MSDFSQLKHKDRSKVFYVDEDEKGNEYLAYKLRNDPLEQVYFVLFLDDYNMFVDENDFGQDVLAYETDDEEVKYIDFDNIELTEDNQLIMKANGFREPSSSKGASILVKVFDDVFTDEFAVVISSIQQIR